MDNVKNYIDEMREKGNDDETIKKSLISVGWREEDISEFFINVPIPPKKEFNEKGPYKLDENFKVIYMVKTAYLYLYFFSFIFPLSFFFSNNWLIIVLSFTIIYLIGAWFFATLAYKYYSYSLKKNGFYKEYGIISKKYVTIPYDKIQNIDIRQTLLERLLGLYYVMIQTAGNSGIARSEGYLPGLDKKRAEALRDELLELSSTK